MPELSPEYTLTTRIVNEYGLHMRPAMGLQAIAAKYEDVSVTLRVDGETASVESLADIFGLGAVHGKDVTIVAKGRDAKSAALEIKRYLDGGCDEGVWSPPEEDSDLASADIRRCS